MSCLVTVPVALAVAVGFCPVLGGAVAFPLCPSALGSQNQPPGLLGGGGRGQPVASWRSPHLGGLCSCSVGALMSFPYTRG